MNRDPLVTRDLSEMSWNVRMQFLYAVEFTDGRVKIGATKSPKARLPALRTRFGAIVRAELIPFRGLWWHQAERAALHRARRIGSEHKAGAEVFTGLKFGEATTLLRQMAARQYTLAVPPSMAKRRAA